MKNHQEITLLQPNVEFGSLKRNEVSTAVSFVSSINKKTFPFIVQELINIEQYQAETQKMIQLSSQFDHPNPISHEEITLTKVLRLNGEIVALVIGIDFQRYFQSFSLQDIEEDPPNRLLKLGCSPNNQKKAIYIGRLCVSEQFRGRGLGTNLLRLSYQFFAKQGYEVCYQRTISDTSLRLFKKVGASIKGKATVQFPNSVQTIHFLGVDLCPADDHLKHQSTA